MSEQNITPFLFEGESLVRVALLEGEPWFVAADVCRVLGIKNVTQAVAALDDDERAMFNIGPQMAVNVISEGGFYTLALRSRKAMEPGTVQHRFRRWVTSEVLPTIRKAGSYNATKLGGRRQPDPMVARNRSTAMAINSVTHALGEIRRTRGVKVASKAAGELYKKIGINLGDDLPEQPELGLDPLAAE